MGATDAQDVTAAIASVDQVSTEMERVAGERHAVDEAKRAIASHEYEQSTLQHRAEQLDRQVKLAADRLERGRRQLEEKRAASRASMDDLKRRLEDISRVRKQRHALVEERNTEGVEIERQLETLVQEHDAHYAKMQLEKESLCRAAGAYMDALSRALVHT